MACHATCETLGEIADSDSLRNIKELRDFARYYNFPRKRLPPINGSLSENPSNNFTCHPTNLT